MQMILGHENPTFIGKLRRHYFILRLMPGLQYKYKVLRGIIHRLYIGKYLE